MNHSEFNENDNENYDFLNYEITIEDFYSYCPDHPDHTDNFCILCKISVCSKCNFDNHKNHFMINKSNFSLDNVLINKLFMNLEEDIKEFEYFTGTGKLKENLKTVAGKHIDKFHKKLEEFRESINEQIDSMFHYKGHINLVEMIEIIYNLKLNLRIFIEKNKNQFYFSEFKNSEDNKKFQMIYCLIESVYKKNQEMRETLFKNRQDYLKFEQIFKTKFENFNKIFEDFTLDELKSTSINTQNAISDIKVNSQDLKEDYYSEINELLTNNEKHFSYSNKNNSSAEIQETFDKNVSFKQIEHLVNLYNQKSEGKINIQIITDRKAPKTSIINEPALSSNEIKNNDNTQSNKVTISKKVKTEDISNKNKPLKKKSHVRNQSSVLTTYDVKSKLELLTTNKEKIREEIKTNSMKNSWILQNLNKKNSSPVVKLKGDLVSKTEKGNSTLISKNNSVILSSKKVEAFDYNTDRQTINTTEIKSKQNSTNVLINSFDKNFDLKSNKQKKSMLNRTKPKNRYKLNPYKKNSSPQAVYNENVSSPIQICSLQEDSESSIIEVNEEKIMNAGNEMNFNNIIIQSEYDKTKMKSIENEDPLNKQFKTSNENFSLYNNPKFILTEAEHFDIIQTSPNKNIIKNENEVPKVSEITKIPEAKHPIKLTLNLDKIISNNNLENKLNIKRKKFSDCYQGHHLALDQSNSIYNANIKSESSEFVNNSSMFDNSQDKVKKIQKIENFKNYKVVNKNENNTIFNQKVKILEMLGYNLNVTNTEVDKIVNTINTQENMLTTNENLLTVEGVLQTCADQQIKTTNEDMNLTIGNTKMTRYFSYNTFVNVRKQLRNKGKNGSLSPNKKENHVEFLEDDDGMCKPIVGTNEIHIYDKKKRVLIRKKVQLDKHTTGYSVFLDGIRYVVIGDKLYITGGRDSVNEYNNVLVYNIKKGTIARLADMENSRSYHSLVYSQAFNTLLAIGGENNPTCELYEIELNHWTLLPELVNPRANITVYFCDFETRIYSLFGSIGNISENNTHYSDVIEVLNLKNIHKGWSVIDYHNKSEMEFKQAYCSIYPLTKNKLLIYGANVLRDHLKSFAVFDLVNNEIIKVDKGMMEMILIKAKKSARLSKILGI